MYLKYLVMKMQFSFLHNVLKPGKNLSKFSLILISNAHTKFTCILKEADQFKMICSQLPCKLMEHIYF